MAESSFRFRQFTLIQEKSAARIGSDSILLGAWANTGKGGRILDIGTGTGILALMAAQRNPAATIDAVEIDPASAEEAKENFQHSPWANRLRVVMGNILEIEMPHRYDRILSIPPYFPSIPSPDPKRRQWRTADSLTPNALLAFARDHLTETGQLSVILPHDSARAMRALASDHQLPLIRQTHLIQKRGKSPSRELLAFSRTSSPLLTTGLTLQIGGDKDLSVEAAELLRTFYPWLAE